MLPLLAAVSLMTSIPYDAQAPLLPPTVDISAVREILCYQDGEEVWRGSGFIIGNKIMATAMHVVVGAKCEDHETRSPIMVYKLDPKNDLALVTAPKLPMNIPYIKISCAHYEKGVPYIAYGRTSFGMDDWSNVITRSNTLYGTGVYNNVKLDDGSVMEHAAILSQHEAPGMSGGPITNLQGYALSLVNAGNNYQSYTHEFADGMLCKR